jgi:hypothetical protein
MWAGYIIYEFYFSLIKGEIIKYLFQKPGIGSDRAKNKSNKDWQHSLSPQGAPTLPRDTFGLLEAGAEFTMQGVFSALFPSYFSFLVSTFFFFFW